VTRLPAHSFLLDGEAIVTNDRGLAVFDLIRYQRLEGEDLRRTPIEQRKRKLAKLVRGPHPGIGSTKFSKTTATSSLSTPASSAAKASWSKRGELSSSGVPVENSNLRRGSFYFEWKRT
jgi:ATP-dependent DNA ligase